MKKNRDYPLAPTNFGGGDDKYNVKSKKLEAKSTPAPAIGKNGPTIGYSKTKEEDRAKSEKKVSRRRDIEQLKTFGKRVVGGGISLVGAYYGLTKKSGGKEIKDYSGNVTGKTPEKRIWLWEKE